MKSKSSFTDRTLIRLRREYSKDEVFSALNNRLKKIEFENGVLKSEVAELNFLRSENKKLKQQIKQMESTIIDLSKNKVLSMEIKELKAYIQHLENKIY